MAPACISRAAAAGVLTLALLGTTACGRGGDAQWTEPAVGSAVLPDFTPRPPTDLHTRSTGDSWALEFSSSLVNVGDGDFHATANKGLDGVWVVTQDIEYDGGGAEHVSSPAQLEWGGDGHEHWHVKRYVTYHLRALDRRGRPTGPARTDHKVGFCIYDFRRAELDMGPTDPVYRREDCGSNDSTHLVMGLSPGWVDYYHWMLPGQSIPIDGLPDGDYRIFAVADPERVFREETTDNNRTWVDFELSTSEDGTRSALMGDVGPTPV